MTVRCLLFFFFFQAEDGIRDVAVTGVQTCALPIYRLQLGEDLPGEHRLILFHPGLVGGARAHAHRSTSPITMSTDALMAIKSESRCPSAIFGSAARLMNDGGRIRQRTGLAVPSETR